MYSMQNGQKQCIEKHYMQLRNVMTARIIICSGVQYKYKCVLSHGFRMYSNLKNAGKVERFLALLWEQ